MPDAPTTIPSLEGTVETQSTASHWAVTVLHSATPAMIARRIELGSRLRFGREIGADVDVALEDPKLSRRHATITRVGIVVEIRDHDSRNGTFVNGHRVTSSVLRPGDIVRVGDTLFEVAQRPAAQRESTLVGIDPAFLAAVELAERLAASDVPIVLLGETGTGKDVLARHIHARSGRTGNFVAVNCAAIPDELVESTLFGHVKGAFTGATHDSLGLFLEARGGTLFLDELGELALGHQAKLLRALDAREIIPVGGTRRVHTDARVIAATNSELPDLVASGAFRSDLYARLAGAVIRMPPLRARRSDILTFARQFLAQSHVERRLSAQAAECLLLHPWPRNIRELQAAMRRLVLDDRTEIKRADLEAVLEAPLARTSLRPARGQGRETPTRDELVGLLTELRGNVSQLAEHYAKDAKQIYRWLKRYQLDPDSYR